MAQVIAIGRPVNETERQTIAWLRDHLPDGYTILHNFELRRDEERFEVDLAILAPHAVYLVDVKGTRGLIDVYGPHWYPEGRQPFTSPLLKLHDHARKLKGLITGSQPGRQDLEGVYVDAAILLTAADAVLVDQGGRDAPNVTSLAKSGGFFQNVARIPGKFSKNIRALHPMVYKAITGAAKPRSGPLHFGSWEVTERLGSTDTYTEYRGINSFAGAKAGTVLLRVYHADPYLPAEARARQRTRIANAYEALNHLPGHVNITGARDFFATEHEDLVVLVTEDIAGQALRVHIDRPTLRLTLDQRLRVAQELMNALGHCHASQVVHRNLTPSTILLGSDGRVKLVGFDHARTGQDRSRTIAGEILDELDPAYLAPEVQGEPAAASAASDLFSAGLVLYELFTGERPFGDASEVFERAACFAVKPTEHRGDLPAGLDEWLQQLCAFHPAERPTAPQAAHALEQALTVSRPVPAAPPAPPPPSVPDPAPPAPVDYLDLPVGHALTQKFIVQRKLGQGGFGVVYQVIDALGDVTRAIKIILQDRHSTLERLKKEYRTLLHVPPHPRVVRVLDADLLPGGGHPFIVFEYLKGEDVGALIESHRFSPEDALELAQQVIDGLVHLHRHGVYHCDIKPRNVMWTDDGARIIDFNVSVLTADHGHGGGSRRYLPPDLDLTVVPTAAELADRDLYALGLTLYEAIARRYPWDTSTPPPGRPAPDPRELFSSIDLSPELVDVVLRALAPRRADRFGSATELQAALSAVKLARRSQPRLGESSTAWILPEPGDELPPNTNPFVAHLVSQYSQSRKSNAGTRGLDGYGRQTYVETALDRDLVPAVLGGEFRLVVITGNAGDGKTAFLQQLEGRAAEAGAALEHHVANGCRFTLHGRRFQSNYDGSQDEDDRSNDEVLRTFFAPFAGASPSTWPTTEVRLIAINAGRLIDFLMSEAARFPALLDLVRGGLERGASEQGVALVNLNLRSVVTDPAGLAESILERLVRRMTDEKFWRPCQGCDLRERCYAHHNARSLQDPIGGPQILERLKSLYVLTHLRGRLHVTLRDLCSAVSFMLVSNRDCAAIHSIYQSSRREAIAQGFYFNAWMGGGEQSADRLLTLLQDVDPAVGADPALDRAFDFTSPADDRNLFRFSARGSYDRDLLRRLFDDLPRDYSGRPNRERAAQHQRFVGMARRHAFFERRDERWREMLPYRSAERMIELVQGTASTEAALGSVLSAINRGEGLTDSRPLGGDLALQVREVEGGTLRSYRVFPASRFKLLVKKWDQQPRFVEYLSDGLLLRYAGAAGNQADLVLSLDLFEMLDRLNAGYRPSLEEEQGYYLSLSVFKNVLGSVPYHEVLLTPDGQTFYRVNRQPDGRLEMTRVGQGRAMAPPVTAEPTSSQEVGP